MDVGLHGWVSTHGTAGHVPRYTVTRGFCISTLPICLETCREMHHTKPHQPQSRYRHDFYQEGMSYRMYDHAALYVNLPPFFSDVSNKFHVLSFFSSTNSMMMVLSQRLQQCQHFFFTTFLLIFFRSSAFLLLSRLLCVLYIFGVFRIQEPPRHLNIKHHTPQCVRSEG